MGNKLKEIRSSKKISQTKLAEQIGTSRGVIVKLENGERRLNETWLEKLSNVLGVTKAEILGEETQLPTGTNIMPVAGKVQAGAWQEATEIDPVEQEKVSVDLGPWREHELVSKMFLLRAVGDSMNQADIPDGTLLVCLKLSDFWRDIKSGERVVAYCTDSAGLVEATVKEYRQDEDGTIWLVPRSSNLTHRPFRIPPHEDDQSAHDLHHVEEISIHAVVLGRTFQPFVAE